jgi:hypothetical protein
LVFLTGASVPPDEAPVLSAVPDFQPRSPSHCLSHRRPPLHRLRLHHAHLHSVSNTTSTTVEESVGRVSTFNASELSSVAPAGVFNDEGNMFSARAHTASHQYWSFFASNGLSPRDTNLQKSSWSSTDTSVSLLIP